MTKQEMWDQLNIYEFPGIVPDDVRDWFRKDPNDDNLAEALAQICNRVGMLHHAINEYRDDWLDAVYYDWSELEEELLQECFKRIKVGGEQLDNTIGWHYQIMPFMKAHGYRSGSGWWIRE